MIAHVGSLQLSHVAPVNRTQLLHLNAESIENIVFDFIGYLFNGFASL